MTHIAELGLAPGRFAIELGLRVACALMRVVLAPLAMKVRAIAVIRARWKLCEAQASMSVPSTEKCSSDSKGLTLGRSKSLSMNFRNTSPR